MTTLLIGAGGQVGAELLRRLRATGPLVATTRTGSVDGADDVRALDVGDLHAVAELIADVRPSTVINATAHTAVDRAESEPELAYRLNRDAPGAMAEACRASGARFVHYSTDYVFDGTASRPYREDNATAPSGVYGASKRAGEEAVLASGADALILRTAWVYARHGHNFLRTMLRLGAERDTVRVVADQVGSPTPAWMIADATLHLLAHAERPQGIVHVVADGQTSWHGFADAIFDEAEQAVLLTRRPEVEPIATVDYPTPARRPAYSVLDTGRLRAFGYAPPPWREGLAATLRGSHP